MNFIENTIDPNLFQIEDVADDNACMYRALANILHHRIPNITPTKLQNRELEFTNIPYENIYQHKDWGYYGEKQNELAKELQQIIRQWIIEHKSTIINDFSIEQYVELTHEMNIEEYRNLYKHFAGNDIPIKERWGGLVEQIAISEFLRIPIIILNSQRILKNGKIVTGQINNNIAQKGVRLKVYQIIGKQYTNKPLYLLWKRSVVGEHYMALYPKNDNDIVINL